MSVITTRMCDQCENTMISQRTWMTLSFPMVEDSAPEFDFCTYECLQSWVNEEDDEPNEELVEANERRLEIVAHEQQVVEQMEEALSTPLPNTMSLAEAIANGLRPGNPV